MSLRARFYAKIDFDGPDGCWLWTACATGGYGEIWDQGRMRKATHVSWEIKNKQPFPKGKFACHHCDIPACVNPEHLYVGDAWTNFHDAIRRGRHTAGQATCTRGHEYTPENTYIHPRGHRRCRECQRAYA